MGDLHQIADLGNVSLFRKLYLFQIVHKFQIFDYSSPVSIIVCFVIKMVIDIAAIAYVFKVVVREMNYAND